MIKIILPILLLSVGQLAMASDEQAAETGAALALATVIEPTIPITLPIIDTVPLIEPEISAPAPVEVESRPLDTIVEQSAANVSESVDDSSDEDEHYEPNYVSDVLPTLAENIQEPEEIDIPSGEFDNSDAEDYTTSSYEPSDNSSDEDYATSSYEPIDDSSDEEFLRTHLNAGDEADNVWDIVSSLDEDEEDQRELDRLLDEINDTELDDTDLEDDYGLPEEFDTSSSDSERDISDGVNSCMFEIGTQVEPIINLSQVLLEARKAILENDISQLQSVETILMQQPDLIDGIVRNSKSLVAQCVNYKNESIEAERKTACLNPKNNEQTTIADAVVDRINFGFSLIEYPILSTYHDLMVVCDSAIDSVQNSQLDSNSGSQESELPISDEKPVPIEHIVG